jgi:hypothetical protein
MDEGMGWPWECEQAEDYRMRRLTNLVSPQ